MRYWQEKGEEHKLGIGCYCNPPEWYCMGYIAERVIAPKDEARL